MANVPGEGRTSTWPILVIDCRAVGKPGGPPAERADCDNAVLTRGQYGQVDGRVVGRQKLDVTQPMCGNVLDAPSHVIAAYHEHAATSCAVQSEHNTIFTTRILRQSHTCRFRFSMVRRTGASQKAAPQAKKCQTAARHFFGLWEPLYAQENSASYP